MRLTYVPAGTPEKRPVILSHVPPSFLVTQTLPSSVPTNNSPGRSGDSPSDTIVQYVSAPVTPGVSPRVVSILARIFIELVAARWGEVGHRPSTGGVAAMRLF